MKRKILSLILAFAMTVSLLTVGTGAVEPTYGDTAGHWAESSIERWSAYGIIQGSNGQFDPNGQLTCAQLATILAKLLKLPAAKDAGFTDNTADAWYYDAINRCAAAGILNGNGDGTVTPEAPITRERAMVMLARALGIEPLRNPDLTKYTDAAQVSAYAQGYVAALIEAGIVGGVTADELAPQANINRASTVTILDRAIGVYADKDGMTVNAKDGELVLVVAKNVKVINAPEGTKIVVADGATGLTVNGKSVSDDQTYIVPKTTTSSGSSSGGYSHSHSYDATSHKCSCGEFAPDVVATIGDTNGYLTLKAAVAAATNGATVKLVKGALLDADIPISSKITLDLNGNTIETNGKKISVAGTGDLTVTGNGIVNNQVDADNAGGTPNRYTMLSVEEGGKLTIENGTFTTKAAQIVYTYGSTMIRGGTFKNTSTNTSKETVDALNSGALIVVRGTSASLTMTDGTVTTESQYLYGVFVRDGGNAIFGDEETENGPSIHTHRYAAIGENNTMPTANITIYGGVYTVPTVPASDTWEPYCATIYASASGEINIHGGTFTGYYAISDRYQKVEQTVTITGGTFNGAEADLHVTSEGGKGTTANRIIAIAGGTFSTEPENEYIAKGYTKESDNGKWNVVPDTSKTYVAQVGVNKYGSLADALAAAEDGDIVKLLKDVTEDVTVSAGKTVIIDLNGKKLANISSDTIVVENSATLTITGTGTVDNVTHGKAAIYNNGTVILNGGSYTRSAEASTSIEDANGNSYYNILNHGTMTIEKNVSVTSSGSHSSLVANGYYDFSDTEPRSGYVPGTNQESPKLTINGGTFSGGINTIKNDDNAILIINDGSFSNVTQAVVQNNHVATINGGTFDANAYHAIENRHFDGNHNTGSVTVTNGVFTGGLYTTEGAAWNITGGTYNINPSVYVPNGYMVENDNGIYTVREATWNDYTANSFNVVPAGFSMTTEEIKEIVNVFPAYTKHTITISSAEALLYYGIKFDLEAAKQVEGNIFSNNRADQHGHVVEVKLGADIDLNNIELSAPLNIYAETFDGCNKTISNATITNTASNGEASLFRVHDVVKSTFKNVIIKNITVVGGYEGNFNAGVVFGMTSGTDVSGVKVVDSSVVGGKYTGAIVGYAYGNVDNCAVENTTVNGGYKVGGITGYIFNPNSSVTNNSLTGVTVKADPVISGKTAIIGKIVGNWNTDGNCYDNSFADGVTNASDDIGHVETGKTVNTSAANP